MAGEVTRTVLAEISKYVTIAPLLSAYNQESVLYDLVRADFRVLDIAGRAWLRPVRKSPVVGIYSRAELGTIGTAVPADYAEQTVTPRYIYGPITVSGPAEEFSRGRENALVDAVAEALETTNLGMARTLARMLWTRNTGGIAFVNGTVTASTTIPVDTPGSQYIENGMLLDIGTAAELAAGTHVDATVSTVDSDTQITSTAAVTLVDNDIVVIDGNYNIEPLGLGDIFYDGTNNLGFGATTSINGLTRSSDTWTYPYIYPSVGNAVTVALGTCYNKCRTRGGGRPKVIVCSPGVKHSIFWTIKAAVDYMVPHGAARGGVGFALGGNDFTFMGIPVRDDPQSPVFQGSPDAGVACLLDTDYLEMFHTQPPHLPEDAWIRSASIDQRSTYLRYFVSGIVCTNYMAQAAATGITIDNASAA